MNRTTIDRLMTMCEEPPRRGEWREFCEREGVCYDTLRYWRDKLQLRRRKKSVNPEMQSYVRRA